MLDDTGIGPTGTIIVQNIARLFLSRVRPADAVAVVRLTHRDDEAITPLLIARERIDEYRARSVPYFGRETIEESLQALTRMSRELEPIEHRRKAVVCIGRRSLCDLYLEAPENSLVWRDWRDALSATARANVSLYVVDPAGVTGRVDLGDGLVEHTGGEDFVRAVGARTSAPGGGSAGRRREDTLIYRSPGARRVKRNGIAQTIVVSSGLNGFAERCVESHHEIISFTVARSHLDVHQVIHDVL